VIAFAEFLRIVRASEDDPYPWQTRLARRCAGGEPPSAITVPTGAGKTTTVDALVWALAQQADRPAAERTVGVRIVWAIDRRILVDEAYGHAEWLAGLLVAAVDDPGNPLCEFATRLACLSGGPPLVATRWRGGLEDRPERCGPLQPQVITSTVGQIGSRLLFRGYGVGRRSLAIEAGLAACDTTICLDEAHLAEPLRETIEAICEQRRAVERSLGLPGLRAITLTATPPRDVEDVLGIDDDDRVALGKRLTGEKRARLIEPESGAGEADKVKLLAKTAAAYVRSGKPTVACVVNTVRRARAVFDALEKQMGEEADVALLIGPQRPADRERMLELHGDVLFKGKPAKKPLICVATQTFEVGLDADVTALVTESASATALVQRLGRLNRSGATPGSAAIVRDDGNWLYDEDESAAWDWLQGLVGADGSIDVSVAALERSALPQPARMPRAATLTSEIVELLAQTSPRPESWREPDPDVFVRGAESKPAAEVAVCWRCDLRPDLIDPSADAYRSALLDLVPPQRRELMTVSLTSTRALIAARCPGGGSQTAAARLALSDADVEDAMPAHRAPEPRHDEGRLPFLVLRRGEVRRGTLGHEKLSAATSDTEDAVPSIWPGALRPGDIIVLPTSAGGVDEHGLAPLQPRKNAAVDVAADLRPDVADSSTSSTPAPVRLTPEALGGGKRQLTAGRWKMVTEVCTRAEKEIAQASRHEAREQHVNKLMQRLCGPTLLSGHEGLTRLAKITQEHDGWTVLLRSVGPTDADGMPERDDAGSSGEDDMDELASAGEASDAESSEQRSAEPEMVARDDDDGLRPLTRVWVLVPVASDRLDSGDRRMGEACPPPSIDQHARAVSSEVRSYAERLKLAPGLSEALMLAARAHDHGKADPRTQAFYRGGVPVLAATSIAKSEFGTQDPRTSHIAARLAGLPRNQRHEIASVAVLEDALATGTVTIVDGMDRDLALHGVGTHHDFGRPIPPVPEGGRPARPFAIDAADVRGTAHGDGRDGWADGAWLERFWRVFERYGAWGMAYLEALLVLSDRVVSSRGE
jgi:CRISPR-associated endonuclease/helicase Cas3